MATASPSLQDNAYRRVEESRSPPIGLLEALGVGWPRGWRSSGSTGSEGGHGSDCPAAERGWGAWRKGARSGAHV